MLIGAEALTKSNVQALPFISEYKWAAISVMVLLFVIEAAMEAVRVLFPQSLIPIYVSCIVAFLVETALVACYLSAAVMITRRIGRHGKNAAVRSMTVRIAVSCVGYGICLASMIAFAVAYQHVWGKSMTLNAIFLGFNIAGIMQVLALKPAKEPKPSSASISANTSANVSIGIDSARGEERTDSSHSTLSHV